MLQVSHGSPLSAELGRIIRDGVGAAWASAIPVAGLQAMYVRGRDDLLARIQDVLPRSEAAHRLCWREPRGPAVGDTDISAWYDDGAAVLGFVAGPYGAEDVDDVAAWVCEQYNAQIAAHTYVGAVLAAPGLRDQYADRFPSIPEYAAFEHMLDDLTFEFPCPNMWVPHLGAALRATDRDGGLDRIIAAMVTNGQILAEQYVAAVSAPVPEPIRARAFLAELLSDVSPERWRGSARARSMHKLGRYLDALAVAGEFAAIHDAVERITPILGRPERWGPHAYVALCAIDRPAEASRADPSPRLRERISLLDAYARLGDRDSLHREIAELVGRVVPAPVGLGKLYGMDSAFDDLLTPAELVRVARLTDGSPQRRERLEARLRSLAP